MRISVAYVVNPVLTNTIILFIGPVKLFPMARWCIENVKKKSAVAHMHY
jgi:hypothetical protein